MPKASLNVWFWGFISSLAWLGIGFLLLILLSGPSMIISAVMCGLLALFTVMFRKTIIHRYYPSRRFLTMFVGWDSMWILLLSYLILVTVQNHSALSLVFTYPWKLAVLTGGLGITLISLVLMIVYYFRDRY